MSTAVAGSLSQVVEWRDSEHEGLGQLLSLSPLSFSLKFFLGVDSIASECYREPPAVSFRN